MQGIDLHSDRTTIVAEFVRDIDMIAVREHVKITALDSSAPAGSGPAGSPALAGSVPRASTPIPADSPATAGAAAATPARTIAAPIALDPIPLNLTLRGGYLPTLRTLERLSSIHVLARVQIASLSRVHGARRGESPDLATVMNITLYRMLSHPASALPATNGVLNAGARPT